MKLYSLMVRCDKHLIGTKTVYAFSNSIIGAIEQLERQTDYRENDILEIKVLGDVLTGDK